MSESSREAEELFHSWIAKRREGEGIEAFASRHPEHEAELVELWSAWQRAGGLIDPAAGASSSIDFVARFGERRRIRLEGEEPDPAAAEASEQGERRPVDEDLAARLDPTRYEFVREIAEGGQGVVLKVEDQNLSRPMAMKVLKTPDEGSQQPASDRGSRALGRFLEEAQVTAQLDHPGIPPVHELGVDREGRVFFTMKYVKGRDLEQVLRERPDTLDGRTLARLLEILIKVCDAMSYAHSKQVLHRDLKPSNVMVGRYGEVYVMDWGLARVPGSAEDKDIRVKAMDSTVSLVSSPRREMAEGNAHSPLLTMDGDVLGTPAYMSPEQAFGDLDQLGPPSDVYAIGSILYHILTGHMPYVPKGGRINHLAIWQRLQEAPPLGLDQAAPDAPAELVAICDKAMAREVGQRYPSAAALAEDLRAYQEQRVVSAYSAGPLAEIKAWVRRNKGLAAAIMAFVGASFVALLALAKEASARQRGQATNSFLAALEPARALTGQELPSIGPAGVDELKGWLADSAGVAAKIQQFQELRDGLDEDLALFMEGELSKATPPDGKPDWVRSALETSQALAEIESSGRFASLWAAAAERVARDARFESAFGGRALERQVGLVPLGPDPATGFEEFVHLASCAWGPEGPAIPERGAEDRLILGPEHGVVLVLLPGGETTLGARRPTPLAGTSEARLGYMPEASEQDPHPVELDPFLVGKYEVTFAQWLRLGWRSLRTEYSPEALTNVWYAKWAEVGLDEHDSGLASCHPVETIDWYEASEVSRLAGLALPTEAQWEYAARGGTETLWWSGDSLADAYAASNCADQASAAMAQNFPGESGSGHDDRWPLTAPVHLTPANAYGIHGVIGNVREWCADLFGGAYGAVGQEKYASGTGRRLDANSDFPIIRGGSFDAAPGQGRSANRLWGPKTDRKNSVGVRFARSIDG